jgi:dihydroxyacid dehydratase/phosphogluconate dehydratase
MAATAGRRVLVASTWDELDPGNVLLRREAEAAIEGVWAAGGTPVEASLAGPFERPGAPSADPAAARELIAATLDRAIREAGAEAAVVVAADGAAIAGALVGIARAGVAGIVVPGGPSVTGYLDGAAVTVADVARASSNGGADLERLVGVAWPGSGVPPLQLTAETMASVIEALGLAVPGSAGVPAIHQTRDRSAHHAGEIAASAATPLRELITAGSLANATAIVAATGGSADAVRHLLALAEECGVGFTLADAATVIERTPRLADLLPHGRFDTVTFERCGGVGAVLALLLERGLLAGEEATVDGASLATAYGSSERYDAAAAIVLDDSLDPALGVSGGELWEAERPAAAAAPAVRRSAFRAMGLSDADGEAPLAAVASAWSAAVAAGSSAPTMGEVAEEGAWAAGATPRRLALHSFDPDAADPAAALELMSTALERALAASEFDLLLGVAADELGIAALALAAVRSNLPTAIAAPAGLQQDSESLAMARAVSELGLAPPVGPCSTLAEASAAAEALGAAARDRRRLGSSSRAEVDSQAMERAAAAFGELGAAPDALLPLIAIGAAAGLTLDAEGLLAAADRAAAGRIVALPGGAVATAPVDAPAETVAEVVEAELIDGELRAAAGSLAGAAVLVAGDGRRQRDLVAAAAAAGAACVLTGGRPPRPGALPSVGALPGGALAALRAGDRIVLDLDKAKLEVTR